MVEARITSQAQGLRMRAPHSQGQVELDQAGTENDRVAQPEQKNDEGLSVYGHRAWYFNGSSAYKTLYFIRFGRN